MMKRVLRVVIFSVFFLLSFACSAYANDYAVDIVLDNDFVRFPDAQPFISESNRTMVPIRFIAENYGMNVTWYNQSNEVLLEKDGTKIKFAVGNNVADLNGKEKILDTKTVILNDRTYVPLRFISTVMGYDVNWIDGVKWAIIEESDKTVKFNQVASQIINNLNNNNSVISLYGFEGLRDRSQLNNVVNTVMSKVTKTEYEYFFFNGYNTEITTSNELLKNYTLSLSNLYTPDEALKMKELAKMKAENIISGLIHPNMTEYEKELALHDYIVLNARYDDQVFSSTDRPNSYNIYGILIDGLGVCEGYAKTMGYLLEKAGIKSELVTGSANGVNHAWNQVYIDKDWYNIDVTWDDPVPDIPGNVEYKYFNITDDELKSNHWWNQDSYYRCDNTKYNYYIKNKLFVTSQEGLEAYVIKALKNKENFFEIKAMDFIPDVAELRLILNEYTTGYKYYPVELYENNVSYIKYLDIKYN